MFKPISWGEIIAILISERSEESPFRLCLCINGTNGTKSRFNLTPEEILLPGKYRTRVAARSVLCYFLVCHLGMTATALSERLGMGQPAMSVAVARGEVIVREKGLTLPRMGGKG